MTNKELDEAIAAVDSERFKWDFEYSKAFEAIYTENEAKLTKQQKERLSWDILLFRLRTINRSEEPGKPRFAPMAEYTDGTVFPDPDGFPAEALSYFASRADTTSHPTLQARYLDFIWEKGGKTGKLEIGKRLIKAYLEAFEIYPHDSEIERIDCLYRAIEVALALENKKPGALTNKVTAALDGYISKLHSGKQYRWLLDAIQISIRKVKSFSKEQLKNYLAIADEAIKHYKEDDDNFTLREHFYQLKGELSNVLGGGNYSTQQQAEDIAKSYIDEAERRTDSTFVQQHFYAEAAEIYKRAGLNDKADEMVRRIREIGQADDYESQFKTFSHDVVIPTEEIEKLKKALGSGKELPIKLGLSRNFVPSWAAAQKLAADLSKEFPMQRLFSRTTIGDQGYAVSASNTDEDYTMQQFQLHASIGHTLIRQFLREKIKNKEVRFSDFTHLLKKIKHIDEDTYQTVRQGLRAFFKKDFLAANMILTTQFEDLLRKLMPMFGLNPTRQHPKEHRVFEEKTLNRILEEYRPILGENTYYNFKYALVDNRHLYLRHRDAHGFIKLKDDNELYATIVLQLYCILLAPLQIKKVRQKP